jgi:hypothetical protein
MVAGPNGSGKSTLTDSLRASPDIQLPGVCINADEIQRSQRLDVVDAQRALKLGEGYRIAYDDGVSKVDRHPCSLPSASDTAIPSIPKKNLRSRPRPARTPRKAPSK